MKYFDFLTRIFKSRASDRRTHPLRDWLVLVACCIGLLVICVAWNAWIFFQLASGKSLEGTPPAKPAAVSTQTITDVQDVFKSRAATRDQYQSGPGFVDPSK